MTASYGEKPKEREPEPEIDEIKEKQHKIWQRLTKGARQENGRIRPAIENKC